MKLSTMTIRLSVMVVAAVSCCSSAFADGLPFRDGIYATDERYCQMSEQERANLGDSVALYMRELENNSISNMYELVCRAENVRRYGNDVVFDEVCSAEGEAFSSRSLLVFIDETTFDSRGSVFRICSAGSNSALSDTDWVDTRKGKPEVDQQIVSAVQKHFQIEFTGEERTDLLWSLSRLGFHIGDNKSAISADGVINEDLVRSLAWYRDRYKLIDDLRISPAELRVLGERQRAINWPESDLGDPEMVSTAQYGLVQLGFELGRIDGRFGSKTESAILGFQSRYGFPITLRLDPFTYDRILKTSYMQQIGQDGGTAPKPAITSPQNVLVGNPQQPNKPSSEEVPLPKLSNTQEKPSSPVISTPATADKSTSETIAQNKRTAEVSLALNIPEDLRFEIANRTYVPREFNVQNCIGDRGIAVIRETNAGASDDIYILTDICFSEEQRLLTVVETYSEILFNYQDFNGAQYEKKADGTPGGWISLTICGKTCENPFISKSDDIWPTEILLSEPVKMFGKRFSPNHHFVNGYLSPDPHPADTVKDGVYELFGVFAVGINNLRRSNVEMTPGTMDNSEGRLVVENGVGTLIVDDLDANWPRQIYMRLDFLNLDRSFIKARYLNPRQEGQEANEWKERRVHIEHFRTIHGEKAIGIVGAGDAEVHTYGGSVSSGQTLFYISATPVAD